MSHGAGLNDVKNVIIAFPVHVHRTAGILDLMLDDVLHELSDRGAVTKKVVQNTRPSFSHMWGGAGHETRSNPAFLPFDCSFVQGEGLGMRLQYCLNCLLYPGHYTPTPWKEGK